ncbi:MAG: 1,4-alpha-glucan branching protein domain-containing protein, partial [Myxococcota bacterium]|nr:1,4-alpha-glucan branching protein domain-containing protein [Myxococcota bacterium]
NQQPQWAWRSILEPHYVSTVGGDSSVVAFARDENLCAQLWSADHGYPGDPVYLEFHKKAPVSALRYWRVTDRKLTLGAKKLYPPEIAQNRARLHAYHFANLVEQTLRHYSHSGRQGTLTCCFDAELFGHWWFEGIHFLQALFQELSRKEGVRVCTSTQAIKNSPPDKVVWIPECSWGEESDHRVWLNDKTLWIWNAIHIAEERYHTLQAKLKNHAMTEGDQLQTLVQQLRWNFLLLQASDWPFVIHNNSATDYGHQRFSVHLQRFERLFSVIEKRLLGVPLSEREELQVREAEMHEPLPKI